MTIFQKSICGLACVLIFCGFHYHHENQKRMKSDSSEKVLPLLCDPKKGACEIPGATTTSIPSASSAIKPVKVIYFTDPICSSCWGIEPQLRKMKLEYGDHLEIEYHMGGLLPSWEVYNSGGISKPSDVSHHWDEVSTYYEMPIDGDVWLEDPLSSSYPPSIAFKAAQMQNPSKAIGFLRKIREMVFLEKKNITKWEYLKQAAIASGLNAEQLKKDIEGEAQQLFKNDLDLAKKMGVRGFPTLFLTNTVGESNVVYGFRPYEQFEGSILRLYPQVHKSAVPVSLEKLFEHFPTLTIKEAIIICGKTKSQVEKELHELLNQNKVEERKYKNGSLWVKRQ